jgi:hypothetical protein
MRNIATGTLSFVIGLEVTTRKSIYAMRSLCRSIIEGSMCLDKSHGCIILCTDCASMQLMYASKLEQRLYAR